MRKFEIIRRGIALSVSLLLLLSAFTSCMEKPQEDGSFETEAETPFIPAVDDGANSELGIEYEQKRQDAEAAFNGMASTSPEMFRTEATDGGVKLVEYIGSDEIVIVPDSIDGQAVVSVGKNAFSGKSVRAVSLPDSISLIEEAAFGNCNTLVTLKVPFVGDGGENDFIGYIFGASKPEENAVNVPVSLEMVIVDGSVDKISNSAFVGCKTLKAVVLPDSVREIEELAFYECFELVYISLGGAEKLGEYSFAYCQSLYSLDCTNVLEIGKGTFYACKSINNITLPFVGESLGKNEFLGHIFGAETADYNDEYVPKSLRKVIISDGYESIPARAFTSCERIVEVVLPEGVTNIGVRAFYGCRSLSIAALPQSLTSIGDDAFFACESLSAISFGNKLANMGMQAFYGCKSLKAVALPESLAELKPSTFYGCSSLVDVSLGGVKKVGKNAFFGCAAMNTVLADGIEVAEGNPALVSSSDE